MFIKFTIEKEDKIKIEDYINKPITRNGNPIGAIKKATEENNSVIIEAEIWDRFTYFDTEYMFNDDNNICCGIEIN